MARYGVSREDVFEASEKLLAQGIGLTLVNLRGVLGTGSMTTIRTYLAEFKEKQRGVGVPTSEVSQAATKDVVSGPSLELNNRAQSFLLTIWNELKIEAQTQIDQIRLESKAEKLKNAEEAVIKNQELEAAFSELKKHEIEIEQLRTELKASQDVALRREGEIESLKAQVTSKQEEIQRGQERLKEVQLQSAEQIQHRSEELNRSNRELEETRATKIRLVEEQRRVENDLGNCRETLHKKDGELTGLREALTNLQKGYQSAIERAASVETKLAMSESDRSK